MKQKQSKLRTFLASLKNIQPRNLVGLTLAGIANAIGITMFLAPVNLYDSGISGTSMLIGLLTPDYLPLGLFLVVLNLPLFLFGAKKQGLLFTVYSLWAVAVYAGASFLITNVLPIDVSSSSPFAGQDLLLCAIFGGLISGVGSGLTIRLGGAIDGVEVLAVIFAKRVNMTVGIFVMIYNVVLYIVIGCIFRSWTLPLYSIITYCVAIKTIDFISEGLDKAKAVMIITQHEDEICRALSDEFGYGITLLPATGFYSQEGKRMIYFVVNRFQISKVERLVRVIDSAAFVTITEVSDVLGSSVKSGIR